MSNFLLTIFVCMSTSGTCAPGILQETKYNDLYDCLNAGYDRSKEAIAEIGREDTNQFGFLVRFTCTKKKITEA